MAYNTTIKPIRIKLTCPRHSNYNPVKGEGAIRGGCPYCLAMYKVHRAIDTVLGELKEAEELYEKNQFTYLTVGRKKRKSPKSGA